MQTALIGRTDFFHDQSERLVRHSEQRYPCAVCKTGNFRRYVLSV